MPHCIMFMTCGFLLLSVLPPPHVSAPPSHHIHLCRYNVSHARYLKPLHSAFLERYAAAVDQLHLLACTALCAVLKPHRAIKRLGNDLIRNVLPEPKPSVCVCLFSWEAPKHQLQANHLWGTDADAYNQSLVADPGQSLLSLQWWTCRVLRSDDCLL